MKRRRMDEVTLLALIATTAIMQIQKFWYFDGIADRTFTVIIVFWLIHWFMSAAEYKIRMRSSSRIKQRKRARRTAIQNALKK